MRRIRVDLGERGYDVLVGAGVLAQLGELLPAGARKVAVVTQEDVPIAPAFAVESGRFVVPPGEPAKTLQTVEDLCRAFARFGLVRSDAVVGVGGGVVTDLAGLAAAVYHRGVAVVHVPTTLLAQVDAAIGGKCGVNLPEGKNLVGAFWQPAGVCCDTEVLASLPEREWRSGRGEMVKCSLAGAGPLASFPLEEQVARCIELKAAVVAGDERDGGRRALLNYGHTLGHALETAGLDAATPGSAGRGAAAPGAGDEGPLRHGEAVAVGLVFAARLAHRLGRVGPERVTEHLRLVADEGLPTALPPGCDHEQLLALMARDKKAAGGLTFVLEGSAGLEVVRGVPEHEVLAALAEMEQPQLEGAGRG